MLTMARGAAHASGRRVLAFVTVTGVLIMSCLMRLVRGPALVARHSDLSNRAALLAALDPRLVFPVSNRAPRHP